MVVAVKKNVAVIPAQNIYNRGIRPELKVLKVAA